jgi:lysophospholipase L1-like esterase
MSVYRIRTRLLACCVIAVAALGALVFAPSAGAAKIGSTYLALGDSLAYGYHQAQFRAEFPNINPASFNDGYVDDFGAALTLFHPSLQIINDGCPGETTETMIKGSGVPGFCAGPPPHSLWPYVWLHHPYTTKSQLSDAEAILTANPKTSPITLDIGANDALQACGPPKTCTPAEIGALYAKIAGNVYLILTKLRALSSAQIVVMGLYNPFPTVVPDAATAALNAAEESAAAKVSGTSFADPLPLFNPSVITGGPETQDIPTICAFTAMCPGGVFNPASPLADIHPTKLGYGVLAGVVGFSFLTH